MANYFLKHVLSAGTKNKLRRIKREAQGYWFHNNLDRLGRIYKTDKVGAHFYTPYYSLHFQKFKYKRVNLLEIGVGGYENPTAGGESLRMWKKYFPFGQIFSLDIHDKSALQEKRIKIFKGSQVDIEALNNICNEIKPIHLIIDDGSHINEHVITTFEFLFPKLTNGGIYVIEDTQTSYWKNYGGDSSRDNPNTVMNYFKQFADGLNYKEFILPGYKPTYFNKNVISIHFYHNLIFIYKGKNKEESNLVIDNTFRRRKQRPI